ncbi:hypothetical protein K4L44_11045 [Halosquirtibacter laminarini]|uniref:Uncharacterized protein n=1 Tax=Halosquirtibacter laminarini TaxID=3374600 RepID=A0AC61NFX6_9BACT|nr:hypothetical protein K4L44_11045 [Prolixibacteraceae bacterium]
MKKLYLCLIFACITWTNVFAQEKKENDQYPYSLPIWGDKAYERGIDLPLPIGIGINYVYNEMYLDITEFGMSVNGLDMSPWLNKETLGFQQTMASSNGINLRIDAWVLPFINVYGLFSQNSGSTAVSLKPDFSNLGAQVPGASGLEFPLFSSTVDFEATALGLGATLVYGYKNYFISGDINHSWTNTELLTNQVGVLTSSIRVGHSWKMAKQRRFVFYVGAMYRDFTKAEGNSGSIKFNEALPGIDQAYDEWYNGLSRTQKAVLNGVYNSIEKAVYDKTGEEVNIGDGNLFTSDIGYNIEKDLIQKTSIEFGGQFEINRHWALRGEFGIADELKFILFGMNYRFGF